MYTFYMVLAALVTPLLEKNPAKTLTRARAPLVLSMARVVVLAFASAMVHRIWQVGVPAWPEAALSIAIVLAIPILGALDRVKPEQVLEFAQSLVDATEEAPQGLKRVE